jgi:LPS O-antigen subunit length determinant protein (WzzB/FepE family)
MVNEKNIQPVNLQLIQANNEEDEISLYDILCILVEHKYHIVAITFICTLAALFYAIQAPPVYQAEAYLLPPEQRDIEGINITGKKYSPMEVYQHYIKNFTSLSIRRQFFEESNLLSLLADNNGVDINPNGIFKNKFSDQLSIDNDEKENFAIVHFIASDAVFASEWINKFINFVDEETINSLKKDILSSINFRKLELERKIEGLRNIARQQRLNKIQRLTSEDSIKRDEISTKIVGLRKKSQQELLDQIELLAEEKELAEKLNIIDPTFLSSGENQSRNDSSNLNYTIGAKALEAKIYSLQNRKEVKIDAFVVGLRELEEELEALDNNHEIEALLNIKNDDPFISNLPGVLNIINNLSILKNQIDMDTSNKSIKVDQAANIPINRIKPKRKQIVILGLVLGLILGVLIAFILNFIGKIREQAQLG